MSNVVYRRKPLIVTAEPSVTGNWLVEEGGQQTVYTKQAFEILFDKIELQSNMTVGPDADMFGFDYSWCTSLEGRALINELSGIEMISTDNEIDGQSWMFKPYPLSTFGRLLKAVVDDMPGTGPTRPGRGLAKFVEVGCGVGTKMVLANKLFGLPVSGFDYNQGYCNAATTLLRDKKCTNWTVQKLDALSRDAAALYETADIVYLNRPFVHLEPQSVLEDLVFRSMQRGSYIILGNYVTPADGLVELGWRKITEDKVAVVLQKRGK